MTEKRYYLENFKDFTVITLRLYDRKIKYKHYDWLTESHKIVDLLNELDEKYVDEFSLRETLQQELQRVEKENEELKKELESFKPIIFESDGKPVTLYKKGDVE